MGKGVAGMSEEEKEMMEDETDEVIIVMTDEDGNESYYCEEMIIPVGEDKFALLVPALSDDEAEEEHGACHAHGHAHDHDHDHHHHAEGEGCSCGCHGAAEEEEDAAFFAKIVLDENGEETYVEPSDEEFEAVCRAYEELLDEDDEA